MGVIRDGAIQPSTAEQVIISPAPDRDGLERQVRTNAETSEEIGYIGLVVGLLLAFLTFFLRRRA